MTEWMYEWMNMDHPWNNNTRGHRSTRRKIFPIFTSSVTNPTRTILDLNRGLHGKRPINGGGHWNTSRKVTHIQDGHWATVRMATMSDCSMDFSEVYIEWPCIKSTGYIRIFECYRIFSRKWILLAFRKNFLGASLSLYNNSLRFEPQ
jgi:hypothetical protein